MFRYIAFIWDMAHPIQLQTAQQLTQQLQLSSTTWRSAFDANGIRVFYTTSRADSQEIHPLFGQSGIVLHELFDRGEKEELPSHRPVFDMRTSALIIDSEGRHLVDAYWGNYVAFLCSTPTRKKWVLRAPTGHLPCVRTSFKGVQIYFSLMADVVPLALPPFSIDWSYVVTRLASLGSLGTTGLLGVSALQWGECSEIQGTRVSQRYYWDPYRIACTDIIEDPVQAAAELRRVTRSCVHAWASRHDSILMQLSGGLDSTVVLSCLADAPTRPNLTCVNYYSGGPREDERRYARAAAERAQCKLVERRRNTQVRYADALTAPIFESARPYHRNLEDCESNLAIAAEHGATALCSGIGGDQVFFNDPPQLVVIDYVYRRGVDAGLFKTAWDAGYSEQIAVWKILGKALYRGFIPHRWDAIHESVRIHHLLSQKAIHLAQGTETVHYPSSEYVPEGKQSHINSLQATACFYNSIQPLQNPGYVTPLISQPIAELCLRIPTYLLIADGWDRAVARTAFAPDIPEIIAKRRMKGRVSEYISTIVLNNRDFIRETLRGGILVQQGLIDRDRLTQALADHPSNAVKSYRELTSTLCLEIWLRGVAAYVEQRAPA